MSGARKRFDWSVLRRPEGAHEESAEPLPPATPLREARGREGRPREGRPVDGSSIPLRVNDLKQFAYCPRIVFYQYAMPVQRKATFKMEHGKAVEPRVEQLEKRRTFREYGVGEGKREFQVRLSSSRLRLSGRLDLLITTADAFYPVDFKDTLDRVHHNHHVQLCAYALLVEDCFDATVDVGFIYRVPRNDVVAVEMTPELRSDTLRCLDEIRAMIQSERMPPPTPVRNRCTDCEYRNYCGDVF